MFRLKVQTGEHAGRVVAVRKAVATVGASGGWDLSLGDGAGGDSGAGRFEENAAGVFLCGLEEGRPVKCNGEAVAGSRCLKDGDILEIAGVEVRFGRGGEGGGERGRKKRRMGVSRGLMQPMAWLASALLVAGELLVLRFLIVWPDEIIDYRTEQADIEAAEAVRAQLAEEEAGEKAKKPEAAAVLALPGDAQAKGEGAEEGAAAPETTAEATAAAREVLTSANFEPASAETDLSKLPPISAADPRIADAQRMLAQADAAAQFADYAEAERLLQQLHRAAPGFLPAYEEHARVLEARGEWNDALIRWRQLRGLSKEGSPFRARAEEGIGRVKAAMEARARRGSGGGAAAAEPSGVSIEMPDVVRMPDSPDADVVDMRVLRTAVLLEAGSERAVPPGSEVRVEIEFFDRLADGRVEKSAALTPGPAVSLRAPGGRPARLEVDNHTYVATRGMRQRTPAEYYGCRVRAWCGERLVAETAKPKKLAGGER